ncbi:hypothetical protein PDQ75_24930 [Bacillus cereus group sp. Bc015]|nr:hypothetical protein [Bacillus cereus group sp. Bc015]MDA2738401.1 hypothetical protein [Bacillus cereus group sp. Bc015]
MLSNLKLAIKLAVSPTKEDKQGIVKYGKFLFYLFGIYSMIEMCI